MLAKFLTFIALLASYADRELSLPGSGFSGVLGELMGPAHSADQSRSPLSQAEREADAYFAAVRAREIGECKTLRSFPGSRPFYDAKPAIARSDVFRLLRRMPKGAALHIHSTAAGRIEWIVFNACYRPGCYVYWPVEDPGPLASPLKGQLGFYQPGKAPAGFRPIADVRRTVRGFDQQLLALLTIGLEDETVPDIWAEFGACFSRLGYLISYEPVFRDYLVDAFKTLADDGVDYVELRTGTGPLYDLTGRKWIGVSYLNVYREARDIVRRTHPSFDLKLIICGNRYESVWQVWKDLLAMLPLRLMDPDFVVGYDLVGEEDGGNKTAFYFGALMFAVVVYDVIFGIDLPFYLHDGETNWREESNVRFALLLHARRIGHGLNLHYFPRLERYYIRWRIPLEVCPISNQALRYVADLRTHPAGEYIRRGVACALSSDDPALFGVEGMTYDFWEATMSWDLGLAELKRLAKASIEHSAMDPAERDEALARWCRRWDQFIYELNKERAAAPPPAGQK
jgi:adenosine deaminase CECR1